MKFPPNLSQLLASASLTHKEGRFAMNRSTAIEVSVALLVLAFATTAAAAPPLINLTNQITGGYFIITPDSSRIIFQRDYDPVLFSARVDGIGSPIRLTPDFAIDTSVFYSAISPDSSQFVFNIGHNVAPIPDVNDGEDPRRVSAYSTALDGSSPAILLNTTRQQPDGYFGYDNAVAPDNRTVVMRIGRSNSSFDLYSRPIDAGRPSVLLSSPPCDPDASACPINPPLGVDQWQIADNQVIFTEVDENHAATLFSRLLDGSAPALRISGVAAARAFAITPDSSRVVYSDWSGPSSRNIYSRSLLDGATVPLASTTNLPPDFFEAFAITPDGRNVIVFTKQLSTVPVDGSGPPKTFEHAGDAVYFHGISPDGKLLAFNPQSGRDVIPDLFVSPTDASSPPLRVATNAGSGVTFSADSRRLVYLSGDASALELYSVLTDGSAPPHLLGTFEKYVDFVITPDGQNVIAGVRSDNDLFIDEFYAIPIDGGDMRLIAESPYADGGFQFWAMTPDGSALILATQEGFGYPQGATWKAIYAAAIPEPSMIFSAVGLSGLLLRRRGRLTLQ
jgi:Tol biopolymer transport system component